MTKTLDPFDGKNGDFCTFEQRATSRPPHHRTTFYFRGGYLYSLALPDTTGVDSGLILYRDRGCIVGWCVENRRQIISIPILHRYKKEKVEM